MDFIVRVSSWRFAITYTAALCITALHVGATKAAVTNRLLFVLLICIGFMNHLLKIASTILELAWLYPISLYGGMQYGNLFHNVETYCMFIGYPRSGHSLIGSLIDAHPNIICAHELGVLKYILARYNRKQIYYLLLENSKTLSSTSKRRTFSGYSYYVPSQCQGTFDTLRVIGDKQGDGAILRLKTRPWLLQRLRNVIGQNIKFFHIIRNPYDNISSISKLHGMDLRESIEFYFSLCETVANVKKRLHQNELFESRHEFFVAQPKEVLRNICIFLNVEASDEYLNDCAKIVWESPNKTRHNSPWNQELIEVVEKKMKKFPYLEGYTYG